MAGFRCSYKTKVLSIEYCTQAGQPFIIDAIDLSLPAQKYFDLNNCFVRTIPSWVSCTSFKTCL